MSISITDEEMDQLLQDILETHGYDFQDYAKASLKRRLNRLILLDHFPSVAEFRYRLRNDAGYFERFISQITVNVTEMFRDPSFYATMRREVLPILATYP